MLRFLFAFMLLAHGLIHLMGFVKAFKLAEVPQLSSNISKPMGALWLAAALLFVLSCVLFLLKKESWWMPASAAVLLSQVLIFTTWQAAKFGSIANLIAGIAVVFAYGAWQFNGMVKRELATFLPASLPAQQVVTREMTGGLPPIVQKWLERSGAIGKPLTNTLHLRQKGLMRGAPDGKWMPIDAEQYFTVEQPGFIWIANVDMMPLVQMTARDFYQDGHGFMLVKVLSLFPVADAKGPKTDQGTMLRYLAETCWFPSAALREYVSWEQTDSLSARATMRYGGTAASGMFHFTPEGELLSFDALRYYDRKTGATLEKWHIENDQASFREFEGIRIPTKSTVTWQLESGDFTWLQLEIRDVRYNVQSQKSLLPAPE